MMENTTNEAAVVTSKIKGQCYIILNRPQQYNALTENLLKLLAKEIQSANEDPAIKVIFITTKNPKAFCSGADLMNANIENNSAKKTIEEQYAPVIEQIRSSSKPVIAGIMGATVGAGMSIALACDMIIATESAYMASLFVRIGLVPDAGLSFYLTKLLGSKKSFELMTTGRNILADECLQLGLINQIVANDQLEHRLTEIGQFYENAPSISIKGIKNLINDMEWSNLKQQLINEADLQEIAMKSNDFKEGLSAFKEKRNPKFGL